MLGKEGKREPREKLKVFLQSGEENTLGKTKDSFKDTLPRGCTLIC